MTSYTDMSCKCVIFFLHFLSFYAIVGFELVDENISGEVIVEHRSTMKIFKDIFTGDEMFTDSYKFKLVDDVMYEVYGKYVTRRHGEVILAGANPSAEEVDEGTDECSESGVDIVLNQRLVETICFGDKKAYLSYLKDYMKNVADKLKETNPNEVDNFKTKMNEVVKKLLPRFKDFTFYTGETCDCDRGMVAILEYREVNGEEIPVMYFFKYGLEEEKY